MKSRRRRAVPHVEAPFAYALFGSVDIHDEDFLNFTGEKSTTRNSDFVEFLRNKSFAQGRDAVPKRSPYLRFQQPPDIENVGVSDSSKNNSFAYVEDAAQHVWFISQRHGGATPFARNFITSQQFLEYALEHSLEFPTPPQGGMSASNDNTTTSSLPKVAAKWVDIQTTDKKLIADIVSRFPVSHDTIDHCCYLDNIDGLLAHSALGYFFFNLMCTPITSDECNNRSGETKSVMQRRLDAAMANQPRSAVPAPVAVSVVVFPDWIITVHEKPFHEMGDLLKFLHSNCGTADSVSTRRRSVQFLTSPFIFSSLFQIVVGHQLDNVSLTLTLDRMGDHVFKVEEKPEQQEEVLQRIANVRRCFGECAAELTRREHIVSVLLQPHMMDSFITSEKVVCRQLESARAHILRLSDEVNDCRDTVAVTSWYHNVTRTWKLLLRGNKALRQTLLLTELTNIMYPVITIQTLYAMNVPLPFDSEGDPPVENLKAFFVVMVALIFYLLLCGRAMYQLFVRKRWATKLLAE
ncbi:Mg2+ transporter protein [Trypanosoma melophagium]|uniref:Mg2+ transporter protein n=1 Tax=Trypanosoma melophagium TaxID=715481 RepID=UPI00351A589E|nr:Mg2+ transporter protein [Trypanosoma melophagium]